jgi:hypothetical protein
VLLSRNSRRSKESSLRVAIDRLLDQQRAKASGCYREIGTPSSATWLAIADDQF